ncbi:MAG TPA: hypothetical protein VFW16_04790 [Streptosporangiaceae bacterium]|nr:hypothetical protein [Streptosporangiaceae bacterium]
MSYFHPARMPVLSARRRRAARLQLEEVVRRSARQPRRRPPVVVAAAIAVVLITTGAAAFAVASSAPVTNKHLARCFTVADTSGPHTTVAVAGKAGTQGQVKNARALCAALYREGYLKEGAKRIASHPRRGIHPVPHLVICTSGDGTAAVFPGRKGTCTRLGLPAAARR